MKKPGSCSFPWLVALLAAALVSTCGDGNHCRENKCASGALLEVPLASAASALTGATVTVCRNAECYSANLPDVPGPGDQEAAVYFTGTLDVVGALWQAADRTIELDIEWTPSGAPIADGDHYVLTLTRAAGAASTLLDKTATYSPVAIPPDACPGSAVCQAATLTP